MGLISTLGTLLFFLGLCRMCTGSEQENCTNVDCHFWRFGDIFSVPGDVALLNSSLISPKVFNFTLDPYNISWYNLKTGQELNNVTGRLLVHRESLWFLNVTLADDGEYMTILRTPSHCYRQVTRLTVEEMNTEECARPQRAKQNLTSGVTDILACPLKNYIEKLDSYNVRSSITWKKGCQHIEDETGRFSYWDNYLKIDGVTSENSGTYTCTVTFTLGGVSGSVSETIETLAVGRYSLVPQVHDPSNEIIKAPKGSNFTKQCLVFVPCAGEPEVDLFWLVKGDFIFSHLPSDRVYTTKKTILYVDGPIKGAWLETLLIISELKQEDYYLNYTCQAYSARGNPKGYFTLLPADPDIILPIASSLCSLAFLFIIGVIILYSFKVDIVLWLRMSFPVFYTDKDSDGKLYDAYVAYPQKCAFGFSKDVEMFALHTLPQVLEKSCGYKLFVVGRDCLPGEAIIDSVEENIQASRRMILLYTASTFTRKSPTSSTSSNNNNIIISDSSVDNDNTDSQRVNSCEDEYPDARQQLECVATMHRALLEGTLKVILVELEEISPSQLEQFPESVRHLRKRQGAVCWWKNKKKTQGLGGWRTCMKKGEDEEKGEQKVELSSSLSPSSRFWKEMRYHMPVKGKRVVYPEKTALLNL